MVMKSVPDNSYLYTVSEDCFRCPYQLKQEVNKLLDVQKTDTNQYFSRSTTVFLAM